MESEEILLGDKPRKLQKIKLHDNPYRDSEFQRNESSNQSALSKEKEQKHVIDLVSDEEEEKRESSESLKKPHAKFDHEYSTSKETSRTQPHVLQSDEDRPILWINRLRYYPEDTLLPNMISFREVLFEDLLKKNPKNPARTLETAFMTTYGYNIELIEPLVTSGVKVTIADDWSELSDPRIEKNLHGFPNLTLIRPRKEITMGFRGAFHPKLWVFKFPTFLRVVVATGNLTAGDWIIWANGMWFKDFPKKSLMKDIPQKKPVEPGEFDFDGDFESTLTNFLQSIMPSSKAPYTQLLGFDLKDYYISDIDIVLIPSLPGRYRDQDFDKYGHRKIGAVVKKLLPKVQKEKSKKWAVTYQTSSLGSISEKYIKEFLASVIPNYITLDQLKADAKFKAGVAPSGDALLKRLRIIFPTHDYVEKCIDGPAYAGCLLLNSDNYNRPTFPKQVLHQYQGNDHYIFSEGVIAHIKVFIVTGENGEIDDDSFMYFGSHNFSPSAWGKYEKDFTQFTMSHTELGVLIPPRQGSKQQKMQFVQRLPFRFPPEKYKSNQGPWLFDLNFEKQQT